MGRIDKSYLLGVALVLAVAGFVWWVSTPIVSVILERPVGEASSKPDTYVVRPGDTLRSIARRFYGDPAKWQEIQKANAVDPLRLKPGMRLVLP